jgi:hypothetical protein
MSHFKDQCLVITQATYNGMICACDNAYLCLYMENVKLSASLETLEFILSCFLHS